MSFEALFVPHGDGWLPTAATHGPWGPGLLHGGPVSALCALALEDAADPELQSTRLSVDLIRPITEHPITFETEVVKTGRRLQLVEGTLICNGKLGARASLLLLRPQAMELPENAIDGRTPPPDDPDGLPETMPPAVLGEKPFFLGSGIEVRAPGGSAFDAGRGWFRLKIPVVPGREPSPMQRAAAAADFGNGISGFGTGFPHAYRFLNADLSVYLFRPVEGDWIRLQGRSWWDAGGVGYATTDLSDRVGLVGSGQQALALEGPVS